MLNPTVDKVTERIRARSRNSRRAYLERARRAAADGPVRAGLSCSNMAHVTAACSAHDKSALAEGHAGNIGIGRELFAAFRSHVGRAETGASVVV